MIIGLITLALTLAYILFIIWCRYHWTRTKDKSIALLTNRNIKVAVIVAARNESENLPALLHALISQNYPADKFQIIISDDHSTDNTFGTAELFFQKYQVKNGICLRSPEETKKRAIAFAIDQSDAELIITTDADTVMGRDWISSLVEAYVSTGSFLICGPVKMSGDDTYFENLQSIEFSGLNAIAGGAIHAGHPMFCNGANLAFSKKIFYEVNGYDQSSSTSGDDTQLLLKIHQAYPGKISFLKDQRAVVVTSVMHDTTHLWQQRRRWASKIIYTLTPLTIFVSVLAWLLHAFLIIQFFRFFLCNDFLFLYLPLTLKIIAEIYFLRTTEKFFDGKISGWIIITAQPFYCLYIFLVGLLAPFGKFRWKGRTLR